MLCRKCHYPLDGLADNRCPECGREFDPCEPKSFLPASPPYVPAWKIVLIVVGYYLLPAAVLIALCYFFPRNFMIVA